MSKQVSSENTVKRVSSEAILLLIVLSLAIVVLFLAWAIDLGFEVDGISDKSYNDNLFLLIFEFFKGNLGPSQTGYLIILASALVIIGSSVLVYLLTKKVRGATLRNDKKARFLGQGSEIESLSKAHALSFARKLGLPDEYPGVHLGNTVRGNKEVYKTWEDVELVIAGPRTGKTTAIVVPEICQAPGSLVVTSNKADVINITRKCREEAGGKIWVFDPQMKTDALASWYWNPLSYILDDQEKAIVRAGEVASNFVYAAGATSGDQIWQEWAVNLLQCFLLSAAIGKRKLTDILSWVNNPENTQAATILAHYDCPIEYQKESYKNLSEKLIQFATFGTEQQSGIYGTAQAAVKCLENPIILPWVQKIDENDSRPEFSPREFVEDTQNMKTIYMISQEGPGTAAPVITSFVNAIANYATEAAEKNVGAEIPNAQVGRLKIPMTFVLDEAANICKWKELPNLCSHFGSRSIVVTIILQSYAQGVNVWGPEGMKTLFDASNLFIYGGGNKDTENLESVSKLLGEYDRIMTSVSDSQKSLSESQSISREYIFPPSQLASLPKERAVVITTGSVPTMIKKNFYFENKNLMAKLEG